MAETNEMYDMIANDVRNINTQIERGEAALSLLKEAGENTATLESNLRQAKLRRDKWVRVMTNRGIKI